MSGRERERLERQIAEVVQQFLDGLERQKPRFDDGEEHVLTIRAGVAAWDESDDGAPLFALMVKYSQEHGL